MLTAFRTAIDDTFAPEQRGILMLCFALAIGLLIALWFGATALLQEAHFIGVGWLDAVIILLGSMAALVLAWMLFPAMTLLILGFFLGWVLRGVERRHYPGLGPPLPMSLPAAFASALRLLLLAAAVNVIILPLYLIPGINLFVYYALNGYLVGREYFELVALRRMDGAAARAMWRRHRGRLILVGVVIVFLLSLPLIDLVAPIVAAAFMLHVFEALRRRMLAETFAAGGRPGLIDD
jgi:CysZ protein